MADDKIDRIKLKAELMNDSKEEIIEFLFKFMDQFNELHDLNMKIVNEAGVDVDAITKEVDRRFNQ